MKLAVFSAFYGAVLGLVDQVPLGPAAGPASRPAAGSSDRPNIVFIITDDQDLHLDSIEFMPHVRRHFRERGTTFARHYCTTAICCPSRVSLWTGKQAHNTNVTDVQPPYGGYPKFVAQGLNDAYLPVWLQEAGYGTYYTGKLFNAHTVDNYNRPPPNGWTAADFLLDPHTYSYHNATFQRTGETPRSYPGDYLGDVLQDKARGLLREAAAQDAPFFLGIAPVAPHGNVVIRYGSDTPPGDAPPGPRIVFTEPIPAERHAHLFADARVPRTPHFNPDVPSGADWVKRLPQLAPDNVAANDHYYRQRLRTLQSVDELVDIVFSDLDALGLLENTLVFYTTDNGYHIGQHRLQPGKQCGYEEDVHIPLFARGPGVRPGAVFSGVTTHVDLAPTLLQLAGAAAAGRDDLDGEPIPLRSTSGDGSHADSSDGARHDHVTIEFWGTSFSEGSFSYDSPDSGASDGSLVGVIKNNTYKAVRIVGDDYNLYYAVWCSGAHELYNLETDPYQMANLLGDLPPHAAHPIPSLPYTLPKIVARLDALLLVLKSCRGRACVRPWDQLHPATTGSVRSLRDALAAEFDAFYAAQPRVAFDRCEPGYISDAEGPSFEASGLAFRDGVPWHEWV